MKFAHQLKEALRQEGFPPHWVESAVPYAQLKKCIKKVEVELKELGLDAETLRHIMPLYPLPEEEKIRRASGDTAVAFQYKFAQDPRPLRPKLTLYIRLEHGVAIDASLSPSTKKHLEDLAAKQVKFLTTQPDDSFADSVETKQESLINQHVADQNIATGPTTREDEALVVRQIEVPLTFDSEFFGLLQGDVSILDALQAGEEKSMTSDIRDLGKEVARITDPFRYNKTDLDRWREIFDLYLQAGIFFSTHELDHGSRNSMAAIKQLQWFQDEVTKRGLVRSFKLSASRDALGKFLSINITLLRNMKFQEINQMAISKILKKFDKRTSLGAKNSFPKLINSDRIMSETIAKAVCAAVSQEVIKIVPQLDDYLCPVCFSISYKPVRLSCSHIFCIRCMIKMQKALGKFCPLCRNDVVLEADSGNLDVSLMNFLKTYFPKETRAKQKENESAVAVDRWGEDYANNRCVVM